MMLFPTEALRAQRIDGHCFAFWCLAVKVFPIRKQISLKPAVGRASLTQALRTLPAVQGTLAGVVSIGPDAAVRTGVALVFGTSPNSERSDHRR